MALHWEEARVIVTCGDMRKMGEVPDDAIVLTLKPEEVGEPETIEAVRNLVLDRTIEQRHQVLSDIYELGGSMPDPVIEESEDDSPEAAEAERALLESLKEREDEVDDELDDERDWAARSPLAEGGLWLGGDGGRGVRIFISHVEELVVHN